MDPRSHPQQPASAFRPLELASPDPLLTRDFDSRPALVYERLRGRYGPVAPVDLLGMPVWFVLGYHEVLEVLRNDRGLWSKEIEQWRAYREGRVPADWPLLPQYVTGSEALRFDGIRHEAAYGAWTAALQHFQDRTRPQARRLEHDVRRYADELISLMAEGGPTGWADLSAQYARPLMLMVANRLMGFGAGTEEGLMNVWRVVDGGPDAAEAMARTMDMIAELIAARQQQPGDDLPSYMLAARPGATMTELTGEMALLLTVVGDLTTALICNTIVEVIVGDVGTRASLAAGLIRETVNRTMLANPPGAHMTLRFATADTVLGGVPIAAGDPVMPSLAAAHTDPRFTAALDPSSVHSSRAHLAWGAGAHQCPADELATTLVVIAVERLFERMASLNLALPPDQLPWRSSPIVRGLRSLPVWYRLGDAPAPAAPPSAAVEAQDGAEEPSVAPLSRSVLSRLVRALLGQRS